MRNGLRFAASPDFVGGIALKWMLVDEVGTAGGERTVVELLAVAVDIESLALGIVAQDAPRHKDLAVGLTYGYDTTVEFLHVEACIIIVGLRCYAET